MKILMTQNWQGWDKGTVYDLPEHLCNRFLCFGVAVEVEPAVKTVEEPVTNKAIASAPKRKGKRQ